MSFKTIHGLPIAPHHDTIDTYHGVRVPDPFRYMEDPKHPDTLRWSAEQTAATAAWLRDCPGFDGLGKRLETLWNYTRHSLPTRRGDYRFYWRHDGLRNQPTLLVESVYGGEPVVALDPNALSEDGTVAVSSAVPSPDGRLLAYSVSASGSDWQEIRVRDLATGTDRADRLVDCRFTSAAWTKDGRGFFYGRYPAAGEAPEAERANNQRVAWHRIGTPQATDPTVYARPDDPTLSFHPFVTEDGAWLCLHVSRGTETRNRFYVRAIAGGSWTLLLDAEDAEYSFAGNRGPRLFFKTDLGAPLGRIVAIDLGNPAPEAWTEIVPERDAVLESAGMVGGNLILHYMRDVAGELVFVTPEGKPVRGVDLPGRGTVAGISGRDEDRELFVGFTSFLQPFTVLRHDCDTGETVRHRGSEAAVDLSGFEERQVFYRSKDGTRVPMFLVHKKGLVADGTHPTILYGYGGFKVSTVAGFNPAWIAWLERGGVFACANIRGGGEYGEPWHRDGMLDRKQNVFDDFHAAAEFLVAEKLSRPDRIAIMGGSNGGLLVATCMLQRPDLYGAVICRVPVADMLRYHRFTVGRYWIPEYGDPDNNPEHFRILHAYSPLHNVKAGVDYPPLMVLTADTDDRVVPAHAKKFVATLQAVAGRRNPALLRLEAKAGHGHGKPTRKQIEEYRDIFAFLGRVFHL